MLLADRYLPGSGFGEILVLGVYATFLLVGPAWCSFLCYIGSWDDKASRVRSAPPCPVPQWATHVLRPLLLLSIVVIALVLRSRGAPLYLAVGLALGFGLAGVAVMATLSRRTGQMVHCTVVCPIGLVSNLVGRISPWQVRIGKGCTMCGSCARACRYSALERISTR